MKSILSKNLLGFVAQALRAGATLLLLMLGATLLGVSEFSDLSRSFAICIWLMILMDGGTTLYYSNTSQTHAVVDGHPNSTSNLIVNFKILYAMAVFGMLWVASVFLPTPKFFIIVFCYSATGNAIHFFSTCLRTERKFLAEVSLAAVTFVTTFGILWVTFKITGDFSSALIASVSSRFIIVACMMTSMYKFSIAFDGTKKIWCSIRPFFAFMIVGGLYSQLDFLFISFWGTDSDVVFYVTYHQLGSILSLAIASMSQLLLMDLNTVDNIEQIQSIKRRYYVMNASLVCAGFVCLSFAVGLIWLIWQIDLVGYMEIVINSYYLLPASILLIVILIRFSLYIPLSELTVKGQQAQRNKITLYAALGNVGLLTGFYLIGMPLLLTVTLATFVSHLILLVSGMVFARTLPHRS